MKTRTDGKGQVTTYFYDRLDRLTKVDFDGLGYVSYDYDDDDDGNLLSVVDTATATRFTYDGMNRPTTKVLPTAPGVTLTYTPSSNLRSYNDGGGTVTYDDYDAANNLKSVRDPQGVHHLRLRRQQPPCPHLLPELDRRVQEVAYDASGRVTVPRTSRPSARSRSTASCASSPASAPASPGIWPAIPVRSPLRAHRIHTPGRPRRRRFGPDRDRSRQARTHRPGVRRSRVGRRA